jgi:tRNA G37 N-methylase Trm5
VVVHRPSGISSVYSIGGGGLSVGFLPHFCESISVDFGWNKRISQSNEFPRETSAHSLSESKDATNLDIEMSSVLLVPKECVKRIKTLLEQSSLISKTHRIGPFLANEHPEYMGSTNVQKNFYNESGSLILSSLIQPDSTIYSVFNSFMAIPLSHPLVDSILPPVLVDVSAIIANYVNTFLASELHGNQNVSNMLLIGKQSNKVTKVDVVARHKKAREYLELLCRRFDLPLSDIPNKFELVGDIVMIPLENLSDSRWVSCCENLWRDIAACFQVSRVARKARVDPGPKRESRVELLYCDVNHINQQHKSKAKQLKIYQQSSGWVVVIENGIKFGFDITKVM